MNRKITRTVRGDLDEKFLVRASGDDVLNVRLMIRHDRPNTTSRVAILVLASDRARVTVNATAIIERSAPNTNAWLEIRVITRGSAVATAAPNLEIRNDAVKAGHALSTKHVSDDELFYLMSRGLSRTAAENLILDAFTRPFRNGRIIQ